MSFTVVNGNKISKAKPSGKIILVDNKNYSFEMDMENFISYVLMAQMDESEPEELLKAKSVIIRTYILYKMKDKAQIAASDLGMEYRNYGELKNSRFQDFCRENIKSPKGMAAYFTGIGSYKIYNEKNKKIKRGASVVFISSISGVYVGTAGDTSYCASKGAVNGFTKGAAIELAPQGIRVNSINPGLIPTNILAMADSITSGASLVDKMTEKYPLKRLGKPEDIGNGAVYLLSDASSWVTGQNLVIDGGFSVG